jgi:uncharacterized phage infection (PIP) family protein YhgE
MYKLSLIVMIALLIVCFYIQRSQPTKLEYKVPEPSLSEEAVLPPHPPEEIIEQIAIEPPKLPEQEVVEVKEIEIVESVSKIKTIQKPVIKIVDNSKQIKKYENEISSLEKDLLEYRNRLIGSFNVLKDLKADRSDVDRRYADQQRIENIRNNRKRVGFSNRNGNMINLHGESIHSIDRDANRIDSKINHTLNDIQSLENKVNEINQKIQEVKEN